MLEIWKDTGIKPAALARKPKLEPQDTYFYQRFWELSKSRGSGESFGPIPESEYVAHFFREGIMGVEERAKFCRLVGSLDSEFVDYTHKKRKEKLEAMQAEAKQASAGGKSIRRPV